MNSLLPRKKRLFSSPFPLVKSYPHMSLIFRLLLDLCPLFPATYFPQAPRPPGFVLGSATESYQWEMEYGRRGRKVNSGHFSHSCFASGIISHSVSIFHGQSLPLWSRSCWAALDWGSNKLSLPSLSPALGVVAVPCSCSSLSFLTFSV